VELFRERECVTDTCTTLLSYHLYPTIIIIYYDVRQLQNTGECNGSLEPRVNACCELYYDVNLTSKCV